MQALTVNRISKTKQKLRFVVEAFNARKGTEEVKKIFISFLIIHLDKDDIRGKLTLVYPSGITWIAHYHQ